MREKVKLAHMQAQAGGEYFPGCCAPGSFLGQANVIIDLRLFNPRTIDLDGVQVSYPICLLSGHEEILICDCFHSLDLDFSAMHWGSGSGRGGSRAKETQIELKC